MTETPFTFDPDLTTIDERTIWLSQYADGRPHQLFVASHDGALLGYAESGQFREKKAYETSVETTIYLHSDAKHKGVGTLLYTALFRAISPSDAHRAYAGITLPNQASVALHEKFGTQSLGVCRELGREFGKYWDVE